MFYLKMVTLFGWALHYFNKRKYQRLNIKSSQIKESCPFGNELSVQERSDFTGGEVQRT